MKKLMLFLLSSLLTFTGCGGDGQSQQGDNQDEASAKVSVAKERAAMQSSGSTAEAQLAYIEKFIGQRPAAVQLWKTEPLRSMLTELLGQESDFFLEVMQEAMALKKKEGLVYTIGVAPDHAVPGIGYLLVDTKNDQIRAFAVFGDAEVDVQTAGANLTPPKEVAERVQRVLGL